MWRGMSRGMPDSVGDMRSEIAVSVRRAIAEADVSTLNVAAFCRLHQISRDRFYVIRRRYEQEGEAGLEPRSRAAYRVANRTPDDVEDLIVELRKELTEAGLDAGAATIGWHLERRGVDDPPSTATIWRILSRRGLITPDPKKRPKRTWRSFTADYGNECWQIDTTHWILGDDTEVAVIDIVDDCTRVCIASVAIDHTPTGVDAWEAVVIGAQQWGFPAAVLSDNGAEFTAKAFSDNLDVLGIRIGHSRPYHPQTCGKVERFHQTLKRFLAAQPDPATIDELQHHIDRFLVIYNQQRPHRSLNRRIPADVFTDTPTIGPATTPISQPTRIHHNTVDRNGTVEIPGPYAITVGNRYAGATATTIRTGNHTHVFINHQLVRELAINPNQRRQPLHNRPGKPTT